MTQERRVKCSYCADCLPCPAGLRIPEIFRIYNTLDDVGYEKVKREFQKLDKHADDCTRCGHCEKHCSSRIAISSMMFEIMEEMSDSERDGADF